MSSGDLHEKNFVRAKLHDTKKSALRRYGELVLDEFSLWGLIKYEFLTSLLGPLPGTIGLLARRVFYPMMFKEIGRGVVFGRNLVLRHPHKIRIGDRVVIDDGCLIDARGAGEDMIVIGDDVIVGRSCYIQSKVGAVHIGSGCDIGMGSTIVAQGGVYIHERVGIAGGCKISGGLFDIKDDLDEEPFYRRYSKGPVTIGRCCLLGMGATILDNVTVGEGTMVGSGTVVSTDLPARSVASPRPGLVMANPVKKDS